VIDSMASVFDGLADANESLGAANEAVADLRRPVPGGLWAVEIPGVGASHPTSAKTGQIHSTRSPEATLLRAGLWGAL
jgi:hypothetical protein